MKKIDIGNTFYCQNAAREKQYAAWEANLVMTWDYWGFCSPTYVEVLGFIWVCLKTCKMQQNEHGETLETTYWNRGKKLSNRIAQLKSGKKPPKQKNLEIEIFFLFYPEWLSFRSNQKNSFPLECRSSIFNLKGFHNPHIHSSSF